MVKPLGVVLGLRTLGRWGPVYTQTKVAKILNARERSEIHHISIYQHTTVLILHYIISFSYAGMQVDLRKVISRDDSGVVLSERADVNCHVPHVSWTTVAGNRNSFVITTPLKSLLCIFSFKERLKIPKCIKMEAPGWGSLVANQTLLWLRHW